MPVVASKSSDVDLPIVLVEVERSSISGEDPYGEVRGGTAVRVLEGARDIFGDGLDLVRSCSARMSAMLDGMVSDTRLSEVTLQLAIKLDSEVGAVIAKAAAGAQLQVQLKWKCGPSGETAKGEK